MDELKSKIESLLFLNGEPISYKELADGLKSQVYIVEQACAELVNEYKEKDGGMLIIVLDDKVQICTNPKNEEVISNFFQPIKKANLSTAALETLSIVAYRQPITRLEIEQIRQVQCSYILKFLQAHNLVQIVGTKKALGRPSLYGTTDTFLRMLGISSLEEMPEIDKLEDYDAVRE